MATKKKGTVNYCGGNKPVGNPNPKVNQKTTKKTDKTKKKK